MELKETKAGRPIKLGDIALVPILRTFVSTAGGKAGIVVHGTAKPIGIAVVCKEYEYVVTLTGDREPIERYLQEIPGLLELLETLQRDGLTPGSKRPQDSG